MWSLTSVFESPNRQPFVIAEIGINHNASVEYAKEMIASAHAAGAALIKLQSFRPEAFMASDLPYYGDIQRLALSFGRQKELFAFARGIGANLFSAPFDDRSADFLESMDVPAFKIASMDCNNIPLLRHVAKKGKPVFLATGMAEMHEVERAVKTMRDLGNGRIILFHCVSDYPAGPADMNLAMIETLSDAFGVPAGLSDHSRGLHAAFAALALGAVAVEKHFTLDRNMAKEFPFSDHSISIMPDELKELTAYCNDIAAMRGDGIKRLSKNESENRDKFRRGIYAARDLPAGAVLGETDIVPLRPVRGVDVALWDDVIGKTLGTPLIKGDPLKPSSFK